MSQEFRIPNYDTYTIEMPSQIIRSYRSGVGTVISSRVGSNGYLSVTMTSDRGQRTPVELHRLIGIMFVPNNTGLSFDQLEIDHGDGVKLNNDPSNLEWCTHAQNISNSYDRTGHNRARAVCVENAQTGEYIAYRSLRAAASAFRVSPMKMFSLLNKASAPSHGNWFYYC